jgi:drug/metabolite transporter (DMT)-like permease
VLLAIATTVLIWASAFAGIRAGLRAYSPGELAALRFATASVLFGVHAAIRGVRVPARRDWPHVILTGVLGFAVYSLLINAAEVRVPAGIASFVVNTVPVFTAILSTLFLAESMRRVAWIGLGLSLAGTALIAFSTKTRVEFEPAVLLLVAAAIVQSIYFTMQKPILVRYGAVTVTSWGVWSGTACLLPFLLPALHRAATAPAVATFSAIYLGVLPTVVGYALWGYAISRLPVARVTVFLYFIPVTATLIGWLLLGERPTVLGLFGGLVVIGGVALANLGRRPRPSTPRRAGGA